MPFVDHHTDNGALVAPIIPQAALPVKHAASRPVYAWEDAGLFPIHTPEDASLSMIYAALQPTPPVVREKIAGACLAYQVDLGALAVRTGHIKAAGAPVPEMVDLSLYALPGQQRLRMASREETVKAARALALHGHQVCVEDRTLAAMRVVKQAEHFGVGHEVPHAVKLMAGQGTTSRSKLADAMLARVGVVDPQYAEEYHRASQQALALPDHALTNVDYQRKLAAAIEDLDARAGLKDRWAALRVADPILAVFNTPKTAQSVVKLAGRDVPLDRLEDIPYEKWVYVCGPDIADAASTNRRIDARKIAAAVAKMPMPVQRQLLNEAA